MISVRLTVDNPDNAHIEPFNVSLREECLNINWFMSLEDAMEKLERWRISTK